MLKRVCNVTKDDKFVFLAVRIYFRKSEVLKSVCQNCGDQFFGNLRFENQPTTDDLFCQKCLERSVSDMFIEVVEAPRVDLVGTKAFMRPHLRPKIGQGLRNAILNRDKHRCVYCEYTPTSYPGLSISIHIDHILPYSYGGSDTSENLVVACSKCNRYGGDKIFSTFAQKKDYITWVRRKKKLPIGEKEWYYYQKPVFKSKQISRIIERTYGNVEVKTDITPTTVYFNFVKP